MDERIYQIALSLLNGIGPFRARQLLDAVGSLEGIFLEKESNFRHFHDLKIDFSRPLEREKALIRAEQELEFILQHNIQFSFFDHPDYPPLLKQCVDAPIVLFFKGNIDLRAKNIAIVGTRKASPYGKLMVDQLVENLSPYGVQIVSGLAHGIDKSAHEAALKNGMSTIGVLGHGLDTMYPAAHREIARQMLEKGGVMTEFISGVVGEPGNFPKRNRIVAGLCEATVVVESSESGGSMITASLANDYNREVFAFPGNANREYSSGCNNLIKRSKAHLITSAQDLIDILNWEEKETKHATHQPMLADLNDSESQLIKLFQENGQADVDSLAQASNMESSHLNFHLFNLEMKGLIKTLPGKRYSLA